MRDLYYTATAPKHLYKSEKFFVQFFSARRLNNFGARVTFSGFKKFLVLKKFFIWYYFLPSKTFFKKLFKKYFLKNIFTFRSLLAFFHLLERNLIVLLVRGNFAINFLQAYYYIKSGNVFINGFAVTRNFYATKVGDLFEIFTSYIKTLTYLFCHQLLNFTYFREEYFNTKPLIGLIADNEGLNVGVKQTELVFSPEVQFLDFPVFKKKKKLDYWITMNLVS